MDESFICECGNETFWFYWGTVRCTNCWNEYKQTSKQGHMGPPKIEQWLRRFNKEENKYNPNWEKSKITYKNV